jgi:hypothetical protein
MKRGIGNGWNVNMYHLSEDRYSQLVPSLKTISEMIVAELADCADAIESGLHADGGALRIGLVNR